MALETAAPASPAGDLIGDEPWNVHQFGDDSICSCSVQHPLPTSCATTAQFPGSPLPSDLRMPSTCSPAADGRSPLPIRSAVPPFRSRSNSAGRNLVARRFVRFPRVLRVFAFRCATNPERFDPTDPTDPEPIAVDNWTLGIRYVPRHQLS